jgi:signal peptidase I
LRVGVRGRRRATVGEHPFQRAVAVSADSGILVAVTRLRIAWGALALVVIAALAMYAINPFHVASLDPRARIIGLLPFRMPSRSMEPTVKEGDIFLASAFSLRNRDPRVGEIVVFRWPVKPDVMFVQRVIAVGGMTIEMRHGVVFLDGKRLPEPWLPQTPITEVEVQGRLVPVSLDDLYTDLSPTRVPEGQFFVLGDSRGNSNDSRHWGFVPRELVVGTYVKMF